MTAMIMVVSAPMVSACSQNAANAESGQQRNGLQCEPHGNHA